MICPGRSCHNGIPDLPSIDMVPSILLRNARLAAGLTQAEAARLGDTAQSALSAYENGSKRPSVDTLARLLDALEFRPSRLVPLFRSEINDAARRHRASNVRLFGSTARGQDGPASDLDLLVEFEDGAGLLDLVGLADDLESMLGVRVDVVSQGGLRPHHAEVIAEAVPV